MPRTGVFVVALMLGGPALGGPVGPDVIVGGLPDMMHYGSLDGVHAYAVGTDSCNIGDEPLLWIQFSNEHPVIAQNMYRLKGGRIEQIGQSWLKHGFQALAGSLCGTCQNPGTGSLLGVGCSDPYSAGLNGSQFNLGPRSDVNAWTGEFGWPFDSAGNATTLTGRLQVREEDLAEPFTRYIVEAQYVTPDDAAAGNQNNNASWREAAIDQATFDATPIGATRREQAAIHAWAEFDPAVLLVAVDVPGEGRFNLGARVFQIGVSTWRYEYALHNQTSHRSAAGFSVPIPGAVVSDVLFHDVDSHSGEPYSTADWGVDLGAASVAWRTEPFAINENANALRWGTLYNFGFVSDQPPTTGAVTIELFRPGSPGTLSVLTTVPSSPGCGVADLAPPFGQLDFSDVGAFLIAFGSQDPSADLAPPIGSFDFSDVVAYLAAFGAGCP